MKNIVVLIAGLVLVLASFNSCKTIDTSPCPAYSQLKSEIIKIV